MRTQYFTLAQQQDNIWRITKDNEVTIFRNGDGYWEGSICNRGDLTNGVTTKRVTRYEARKICPKAFRKA